MVVAGTHGDLLREPGVALVAGHVDRWLSEAEAASGNGRPPSGVLAPSSSSLPVGFRE